MDPLLDVHRLLDQVLHLMHTRDGLAQHQQALELVSSLVLAFWRESARTHFVEFSHPSLVGASLSLSIFRLRPSIIVFFVYLRSLSHGAIYSVTFRGRGAVIPRRIMRNTNT
jgi:hypothetical protein